MHHVFVYCEAYREWRAEAEASVVEWTKDRLATLEVEEVVANNLLKSAKSLFTDDPSVWPPQKTLFYLGQLPKVDPLISSGSVEPGEVFRKRLKCHIVNGWHLSCIRLAGRIFGDFQRRMAVLNDVRKTTL